MTVPTRASAMIGNRSRQVDGFLIHSGGVVSFLFKAPPDASQPGAKTREFFQGRARYRSQLACTEAGQTQANDAAVIVVRSSLNEAFCHRAVDEFRGAMGFDEQIVGHLADCRVLTATLMPSDREQ